MRSPTSPSVAALLRERAEVIDRHRVPTLELETDAATHRASTRAKVIDMIFFFIEGNRGPTPPLVV
jgi:hypothetical protein